MFDANNDRRTEEPVLPPPAHPLPTEASSPIDTDLYLYMPLIVVVIFTIIILCLVVIGRKTAASDREVQMRSGTCIFSLFFLRTCITSFCKLIQLVNWK